MVPRLAGGRKNSTFSNSASSELKKASNCCFDAWGDPTRGLNGRPMQLNLRNIFTRMALTQQDIRTLHGVIMSIAEGRKGPARGGLLNGDEAALLRTLLAEHGQGRVPNERGPVRGLARLLRRNPTEAERIFWDAFTRDRRFVGQGFKRQVPVGPHITDVVSFPLRVAIEFVPADDVAEAVKARVERRAYLTERGYRVVDVSMAEVEADVAKVLDGLASVCVARPHPGSIEPGCV